MSIYLIDTPTLIDFSKEIEPTQTRLLAAIERGDTLVTCDIVVTEFYSGVPQPEWPRWDALFADMEYWDITPEIARRAGAYRTPSPAEASRSPRLTR